MYIVAAPSKSGTTSFFKLLTDHNKLPVLQTHDLWHFNVHDAPDGEFTRYMRDEHPSCISIEKTYDYNVENKDVCSYHIVLKNDMKDEFFKYIKRRAKVIRTVRDPYSRAVSAFLHWCQYRQILNELKVDEVPEKKKLDFLLEAKTSAMTFDLMINMLEIIKEKKRLLEMQELAELFEAYFFAPGRLLAEYRCLDHMLETYMDKPKGFKQIDIYNYNSREVMRFLALPLSTTLPRERDRHKCDAYIFDMPVDDVYDYLIEFVKYIDLHPNDKEYIKSRWPRFSN